QPITARGRSLTVGVRNRKRKCSRVSVAKRTHRHQSVCARRTTTNRGSPLTATHCGARRAHRGRRVSPEGHTPTHSAVTQSAHL
ncbi:hypothetical protein KUCAC02_035518, partial [Chaenocephalus aceratus]